MSLQPLYSQLWGKGGEQTSIGFDFKCLQTLWRHLLVLAAATGNARSPGQGSNHRHPPRKFLPVEKKVRKFLLGNTKFGDENVPFRWRKSRGKNWNSEHPYVTCSCLSEKLQLLVPRPCLLTHDPAVAWFPPKATYAKNATPRVYILASWPLRRSRQLLRPLLLSCVHCFVAYLLAYILFVRQKSTQVRWTETIRLRPAWISSNAAHCIRPSDMLGRRLLLSVTLCNGSCFFPVLVRKKKQIIASELLHALCT